MCKSDNLGGIKRQDGLNRLRLAKDKIAHQSAKFNRKKIKNLNVHLARNF